MGMGWSDPGPAIISVGALADDLERLVDRAGLQKPCVLVSASIGGLTAELFARRHPDQVAGLVFADAADSVVLERFASRVTSTLTEEVCLAKVAARLGLLRLIDPLGLRSLDRQQPAPYGGERRP
jgi:pimeloyl-ACP methyl ester carboxylesterase